MQPALKWTAVAVCDRKRRSPAHLRALNLTLGIRLTTAVGALGKLSCLQMLAAVHRGSCPQFQNTLVFTRAGEARKRSAKSNQRKGGEERSRRQFLLLHISRTHALVMRGPLAGGVGVSCS